VSFILPSDLSGGFYVEGKSRGTGVEITTITAIVAVVSGVVLGWVIRTSEKGFD